MTPEWQLPVGADRGLWDYVNSERVAREYDEALKGSPLLEIDLRFCQIHFSKPGRLIDLGCGTGRLLMHFARLGFDCVGVDLSDSMLAVVREKAQQSQLSIELHKGNLVELGEFGDDAFDYAACLFSTLGMIRGLANRQRFLQHVRRVLRPGGVFVLHAHNARYRFGWGLGQRGVEPGDRTMPQHRGGADLSIHHYTRRELVRELRDAGFQIDKCLFIGPTSRPNLAAPWFLPNVRAHGFLFAAR